jgi:hypothetical protein
MSRNMEGFTDGGSSADDGVPNDERDRQHARNVISRGMDMEIFLDSDVGKYLASRAKVEIAEFRAHMDNVDPTDSKAIRDLQQEIAVRKIWKDWLGLAIQEGVAAQELAQERGSL